MSDVNDMHDMSYMSQGTVILGSGLAGLFTALKLAESGVAVAVVHAPSGSGEASALAQGVICSKGLTAAESELFAAKLRGQEAIFSRVEKLSGVDCIRGIVEPFRNEEDLERIAKRVYRKAHFSEAGTKLVRGLNHVAAIFSQQTVAGTLLYPHDFWFDVEPFLAALRTRLGGLGVRFIEEEVARVVEREGGWAMWTRAGEITCAKLVLTAGSQTDALLERSGFAPIGLIPSHGVVLRGTSEQTLPSCAFVYGTKSVVTYGTKVQIGGTSAKEWQEGDLAKHAEELRQELWPLLDGQLLSQVKWTERHGVRVRVKDRMPVVGEWKSLATGRAIYVLTGLYKNGLQLAEACAEHLVAVMAGRKPPEQTRLFDSRRLFQNARYAAKNSSKPNDDL